jgi:two-component system, chemotaxis family, chemotaxis protein CheY
MSEKILFADDSAVIKKMVKRAIEPTGFEVLEANDGKEALKVLEGAYQEVVLVISDWNMPNMNGYELLTAIKANKQYAHIPVLMLTTEGEKANINKAIKAGAANYMLKPFNAPDLIKKVMQSLGR